ncbi:hypothetical protein K469DRAFT_733103 [Zopfia rhizophila CBS 207.26]|uniref:Uncharacterized protein n=1 Tax=Zopfia rhizophila CBS 207.26 TaxID=1314779 RepID=A0A6A6DFH5_9PEZI|nr:hypothetical protein K469DRAFT_733103 [Zopfia rhizophila CBS 207.26]
MSARTLYLLSYRSQDRERAHFAIFVPYATGKDGTLIHVVGAPMAGYALQFKRQYNPEMSQTRYQIFPIGQINSQFIHDWAGERGSDGTPRGNLEQVAAQIPPPRVSENFLAPVNNTTNRRCQEWTMDFVRRLVEINYVDSSAADIVQSKRDPPTHGVGMERNGCGKSRSNESPSFHQCPIS